jgi:hypothetical protein
MDVKDEIINIVNNQIKRENIDKLMQWIEKSDFYTAPASTKYHSAFEGGLAYHSLNVYKVMREKFFSTGDDEESFAICGLFHDICKANVYKKSVRNVKNDKTGQWEKVPCYIFEDNYPFGHGEKSVYMIQNFVRLKPEEAIAIRWHMGGFDEAVKGGSYAAGQAYGKYPLAVKLQLADMYATYLIENEVTKKEN